jgi:hypothetical protein
VVRHEENWLDDANDPDDVLGRWWLIHYSESDKRRTITVTHWSNRKHSLQEPFLNGREPLLKLTEKIAIRSDGSRVGHIHQEVSRKQTEGLAAAI